MRERKIILAAALLTMASAASAETCPLLDYDNPPAAATVSGRITMHHRAPNSDLRAAKGPFLVLDKPLLADTGGGCTEWDKIVIMDDPKKFKFRANQRVTIEGLLDRFGSALVDPSVFITPTTVQKGFSR